MIKLHFNRFLCGLIGLLILSGCASYRFGYSQRGIPGGYTQIAVPVFKNNSDEVGIEVQFTNAMIQEFERSRVARVVDRSRAPVILEGSIVSVSTNTGTGVTGGSDSGIPSLPEKSVLTTEYRLVVNCRVLLRRASDNAVLWEGNFSNERAYAPPRIGAAGVNSANALYNRSVRLQTIAQLAELIMEEAHNRITENF